MPRQTPVPHDPTSHVAAAHHTTLHAVSHHTVPCTFLQHTTTTPGESSDSGSDVAASNLLANLNLQAASKQNLSLPSLSYSLFSNTTDEKGYLSTSATQPTLASAGTSGSSGSRKPARETMADKLCNNFAAVSQKIVSQMWSSLEDNKTDKRV